jgi:hypothetical protein
VDVEAGAGVVSAARLSAGFLEKPIYAGCSGGRRPDAGRCGGACWACGRTRDRLLVCAWLGVRTGSGVGDTGKRDQASGSDQGGRQEGELARGGRRRDLSGCSASWLRVCVAEAGLGETHKQAGSSDGARPAATGGVEEQGIRRRQRASVRLTRRRRASDRDADRDRDKRQEMQAIYKMQRPRDGGFRRV